MLNRFSYLWPGYTDESTNHHVLLIALLSTVKGREKLPIWGKALESRYEFRIADRLKLYSQTTPPDFHLCFAECCRCVLMHRSRQHCGIKSCPSLSALFSPWIMVLYGKSVHHWFPYQYGTIWNPRVLGRLSLSKIHNSKRRGELLSKSMIMQTRTYVQACALSGLGYTP